MTDCSNVEIREQLPDMVSGMLSAAEVAQVEQHLATCADCRDELELLRGVFAMRPVVSIDTARIVAALPAPPSRDSKVVPIASRRRLRTPLHARRIAAAIGIIAIGGLSMQIVRDGLGSGAPSDSLMTIADARDSALPVAEGVATAERGEVAVSFGDLGDYSDEELALIMSRLEQWDGATSTEPMSSLPLLPNGGDR